MLSKARLKALRALHQKKYRDRNGSFMVEGIKGVSEALTHGDVEEVLALPEVWKTMEADHADVRMTEIDERILSQLSALQNPQGVIAIVKKRLPERNVLSRKAWSIYLDGIQDPGNLGTIIRTADWFGIDTLLLSPGCVDPYNPKCVQASMGAIHRVEFSTLDAETLLSEVKQGGLPLWLAEMEGHSLSEMEIPDHGVLVLGNEANGIRKGLHADGAQSISIPGSGSSESLNVSIACAIFCYTIHCR